MTNEMIFEAKTLEGYTIKVLAELLQNNMKTACFEVDSSGINLCMMDTNKHVLISIDLRYQSFVKFRLKEKKLNIGINLNHFHKMLKSIKKKDSLILFITEDNPTDLGIRVIPKENNRITTSYIKIQPLQILDIDVPVGYGNAIIIHSNEFQKMCKDMSNISNLMRIFAKEYQITFSCDADGVYSREAKFGEINDSDDSEIVYDEEYDTEKLIHIIKVAGLCQTIQVYPKKDLPLLFKTNVGTLGEISIYIKSRGQIEDDGIINEELSI